MIKFKKNFAAVMAAMMTGAMAFGLVATAAPIAKIYAEDTTTTKHDQPEISYANMTATITSSDPYVFVEVYKDPTKADKVTATYNFPTKEGKAVVDLGFYKATKAFGIRVYGSSDMTEAAKSDMLTINPQPKKFSFKVDASKATFIESIDKWKDSDNGTKPTADTINDYEYHSLYASEWAELGQFEEGYANAKIAGTTIVVRKKAVDNAASGGETTRAGEAEVKGAPAGPEVKIKIPAAPKAPKVTIDYVKGTVKVTDKMQIALLGENALEEANFKTAKKNMTVSDIAKELGVTDTAAGFVLAVRTAATGSKSASTLTFIGIKGIPALTVDSSSADTATVTIGEATTTVKVEKADNGLKVTVTGTAKLQYEKSSNKWVDLASGTIETTSDTLKVRVAPEKADKNKADSGAFASEAVEIKAAAKDEGSTGGDTTK